MTFAVVVDGDDCVCGVVAVAAVDDYCGCDCDDGDDVDADDGTCYYAYPCHSLVEPNDVVDHVMNATRQWQFYYREPEEEIK